MTSVNKKGQGKYYIIISLILGLMVLSLSLYFIFNEYFTEDDSSWQVCRQSVLLRAKAVEGQPNYIAWAAENFPFKCKTQVIEIDYEDHDKAGLEIADAMASCKALYEGQTNLYAGDFIEGEVSCFHCSRIHFTEEVKDYYSPSIGEGSHLNALYVVAKDSSDNYNYVSGILKELEEKLEGNKSMADDLLKDFENANKEDVDLIKSIDDASDKVALNLIKLQNEIDGSRIIVKLAYEDYKEKFEEYQNEKQKFNKDGEFHWNEYLLIKMKNSDKTYAQYLYGDKVTYKIWGLTYLENILWRNREIIYEPVFDANKGDLLITLVYYKGNFVLFKGPSKIVIPNQAHDGLNCDVIETIPA
jgi:hypothetical protein